MDLDMYKRIANEVKDLDICMLVNNAGILFNGYFKNVDIKELREMSIVNTYPYVLLTKVLIDQICERANKTSKKTAILSVSSGASAFGTPY